MDSSLINDVLEWAWARHHNPLSWVIRPLFLLPWAAFAWRRSIPGLLLTLICLVTSMAWFPAPEAPDPQVVRFLATERAWLAGPWDATRIALAFIPAIFLGVLAAAFWQRSWRSGIALLVIIAVSKLAWSVLEAGEAGWAIAPAALGGLTVCIIGVLAAREIGRRRASTAQSSKES